MTAPIRLYRWFDAEGALLYVGISVRPAERAHQHIESARWMQWAVRMDIDPIVHSDRAEALAAELVAIKTERPVFNISGATDPWASINQYLTSKGVAPVDAPAVAQPSHESAEVNLEDLPPELRAVYNAWIDVAAGIETDPDPERAFTAASEFGDLLTGLRRERSAHRASLVVKIRDTYRLSLAELATRLGVTKTRAGQLVHPAARATSLTDTEEPQT